MKIDSLFDTKFTFLDAVKILLLIVTAFSTWNVVDIVTPDTGFAFVRELAALGVVEGAFLGFEFATTNAKSKRQSKFATIGFFCSLAVIGLFAGTSGLLEFGGDQLLLSPAGSWLGMAWTVKDWVVVISLFVLVAWLVALASLYRFYTLADPEKNAELERNAIEELVITESNVALKAALEAVKPTVAAKRALAKIEKDYSQEMTPAQLEEMSSVVNAALAEKYGFAAPGVVVDPKQGFMAKHLEVGGLPQGDRFRKGEETKES
jgi:hypothetical protein